MRIYINIVSAFVLLILLSMCSTKIKYVTNPALHVIKNDWQGNPIIGNQFVYKDKVEKYSFWEILKWKLSKNPDAKAKKEDTFRVETIKTNHFVQSDSDMIVWLGHSSFYIRMGGKVFVTDPSYYGITFSERYAAMPCHVSDLNNVNYMLLSHDHRDHANKQSIKELCKSNPKMKALAPLRMSRFLKKFLSNIDEAGWYQQYANTDNVKVFLLPANHWCRRGLFDKNKALWGSFILQANGKTIYFAGDTKFDSHFAEIAKLFPNIDYVLMPIGAYKPWNIMSKAHITPEEAVKAVNILKPKVFIPMHYGCYDLSWEPIGDPERKIKELLTQGAIHCEVKFMKIGEELKY